MGVRDEVRDPWSYVVGGLAGGFAWAVAAATAAAVAAPVGVAVGVAVFGTKVLTGAFTRDRDRPVRRDRRLAVLTRTPEAAWLGRAREAQEDFAEIAASAPDGPVAERVRSFGDETADSIGSLERLAGQASAIRTALARFDTDRLDLERERILAAAGETDDPRVLAERQRSLAAVQSQLDAYGRLSSTLATLLARLESGALGIEGLVARLAEVVALSETSTTAAGGAGEVEELAQELEGLRAGLVEAESVSTRAMEGLPPLPSAAPGSVPSKTPGRATGRRQE